MVVTDHQPCQRLRRLPGTAGLDWHLHARQDSDTQDLSDPDLQGTSVAESARECRHGSLSGMPVANSDQGESKWPD